MNKRLKLFSHLISTFIFFNFIIDLNGQNDYQQNDINFNIFLIKDTYLESEPIFLEQTVTFNREVVLDRSPVLFYGSEDVVLLISSTGDTLEYHGGEGDYLSEGKKMYNSKDTLFFVYSVLIGYGIPDRFENAMTILYSYLPKDTYTIRSDLEININKGKRIVQSNTLNFNVIKPLGFELNAYNKFLEIGKARMDRRSANYLKVLIDEFYASYPNSIYKNKVFFESCLFPRVIDLFAKDSAISILEKHLLENPNDYYNDIYLSELKTLYRDNHKYGYYDTLVVLKTKNKGFLLEKYIDIEIPNKK